jgi:hypothetical protein
MTLEVGDMVCVLLGGNLPFILRRQENDEYRLVVESYVHGLMDGKGNARKGRKGFPKIRFGLVGNGAPGTSCLPSETTATARRPLPRSLQTGFVKERGLKGATQARPLCLDVLTMTQISISDRTQPRRLIGGLGHGSRSAMGQRDLKA